MLCFRNHLWKVLVIESWAHPQRLHTLSLIARDGVCIGVFIVVFLDHRVAVETVAQAWLFYHSSRQILCLYCCFCHRPASWFVLNLRPFRVMRLLDRLLSNVSLLSRVEDGLQRHAFVSQMRVNNCIHLTVLAKAFEALLRRNSKN